MGAAFCARCASRLVTVVDGGRERQGCPACGSVLYLNPAPVAMVLAQDAGRLLVVRRGAEPLRGFWAPPSGYVEIDETVEAAAIREAAEETGMEVALDTLEGVFSAAGLGVVLVVYRGRVVGGRLAPGSDVDEAVLLAPGDLPAQPGLAGGTELDRWFAGLLHQLLGKPSGDESHAGGPLATSALDTVDIPPVAQQVAEQLREAGALRCEIDALRGSGTSQRRPADPPT